MSCPDCVIGAFAPTAPQVRHTAEACEIRGPEAAAVLDELDRANVFFGVYASLERPLLAWCSQYAPRRNGKLRILDAGCGSGGLLLRLSETMKSKGIPCTLTGIDPNPYAIKRARNRADAHRVSNVRFICGALTGLRDESSDFTVSSFVLHHLGANELSPWLQQIRRVSKSGALLLDFRQEVPQLVRAVWLGTLWAAKFSRALRADGRASLASAWREDQLRAAAIGAGWRPTLERVKGLCCRLLGRW